VQEGSLYPALQRMLVKGWVVAEWTHKKQLLTYLRLVGKRLGLPINFHVAPIKDGITRIFNGLQDDHAKPQRVFRQPRNLSPGRYFPCHFAVKILNS